MAQSRCHVNHLRAGLQLQRGAVLVENAAPRLAKFQELVRIDARVHLRHAKGRQGAEIGERGAQEGHRGEPAQDAAGKDGEAQAQGQVHI